MIPAYLQSQPHQYTPEQCTDFFAVVYRPQDAIQSGSGGYSNVPFHVFGVFGAGLRQSQNPLQEMQKLGSNRVTLTLPASIPDDRRKNTRVEISP
jgi:hypothetical protein